MKYRAIRMLIAILFILGISCQSNKPKEIIDELLIFGYSGFCFKDSTSKTYLSDEIWYNDSIRLYFDSTRLDIRQYFDFKKDSVTKIAVRRPRKETEYFFIDQLDSVGIKEFINKILVNKNYDSEYGFIDTIPRMYDGWFYTLYYKTSNKKDYVINYVPDRLPDSLLILHNLVMNIIKSDYLQQATGFRYDPFTIEEAKRLFIKYPPPQLPDNTQKNAVYQDMKRQ
jgi:hypothetical protein